MTMLQKFEPKSYDELQKLAITACKSGLMPTGMTPERFIIIAMKGAELGIPIFQAVHGINVINNKPSISAELMLALIYNRVPSVKINFVESTNTICTIEAQRSSTDKISSFTFSMVEAEQAGLLTKIPWKLYPTAMLRARCISAMARAIFPDALMGASYTPEELGAEVVINEDGSETIKEKPEQVKYINESEIEFIKKLAIDAKVEILKITELFKIETLDKLPEKDFEKVINKLNKTIEKNKTVKPKGDVTNEFIDPIEKTEEVMK